MSLSFYASIIPSLFDQLSARSSVSLAKRISCWKSKQLVAVLEFEEFCTTISKKDKYAHYAY